MPQTRRNPITFAVPVEDLEDGEVVIQWVQGDGTLGPKASCVTFVLNRSPSMREMCQIEPMVHDLAGGLRKYVDLQRGLEQTKALLLAEVTASLWPDGVPDDDSDEAIGQREAQIQKQWEALTSPEMAGFMHMCGLKDRLWFLARWEVMLVRATVQTEAGPEDFTGSWRVIADHQEVEPHFNELWAAYVGAYAEVERGKPQGSAG